MFNIDSSLVSIILLNYNGKQYIRECVESILESEYSNFELILVDNNSHDQSIEIVRREFSDNRIKIVESDSNLGFAAGNNLGAQYAKGKYIVLLNIDTIVDPKWLTELISTMESDATIAVAQPKLLSIDDKITFDSAGDYIDFFGSSFRRGGDWLEKDHGQYDTVHDIFSARGAALITTNEIIKRIGLFDNDYFLDYEDIDFCWRVKLYGMRIVFVPSSVVYHKGGGLTAQDLTIKSIHPIKNMFMTMIKNYDTIHMIHYAWLPLLRTVLTGSFIIGPILWREKNKLTQIKVRARAYLWIFRNFRKLRKKRRYVQTNIRKIPDSDIMKDMIKTSNWKKRIYIINSIRLGRTKAKMLYFNQGFNGVKPVEEKIVS